MAGESDKRDVVFTLLTLVGPRVAVSQSQRTAASTSDSFVVTPLSFFESSVEEGSTAFSGSGPRSTLELSAETISRPADVMSHDHMAIGICQSRAKEVSEKSLFYSLQNGYSSHIRTTAPEKFLMFVITKSSIVLNKKSTSLPCFWKIS